MEYVVDTNIVAAAILKGGVTRKILFQPGFSFYAPVYLNTELEEHEEEFRAKTGLDKDKYGVVSQLVLSNIHLTPLNEFVSFKDEAVKFCPDYDDWPFFAVALQRNCAVWSNEKRLKQQKNVEVYNTLELLKSLQGR